MFKVDNGNLSINPLKIIEYKNYRKGKKQLRENPYCIPKKPGS